MKLLWTKHALRQLAQRTILQADEVLAYFVNGAAVLSREERNGTKEWVIFSPADKDCFAVIVDRGGQVITIMPIIWRTIAPGFLDQARRFYGERMENAA